MQPGCKMIKAPASIIKPKDHSVFKLKCFNVRYRCDALQVGKPVTRVLLDNKNEQYALWLFEN